MNIAEILKDCPKGTKLYSLVDGEVIFVDVLNNKPYPIEVALGDGTIKFYTKDGLYFTNLPNGECVLFPSKEQRDWSKFEVSDQVTDQETKPQFEPFDKVLVRDSDSERWQPAFFSVFKEWDSEYKFGIIYLDVPAFYRQCIQYEGNEHLLGTKNKP